jgi:hypothetical protein
VYGGLLTGLTAAALVLLLGRVPFEASVNRAPGSLFTMDSDGYVRNTYLLKVTSKESGVAPVAYRVEVDGLEGAEVSAPSLTLAPEETRTIPLVVRVPAESVRSRSIPLVVRVASPSGELLLPTTFATGTAVGGD